MGAASEHRGKPHSGVHESDRLARDTDYTLWKLWKRDTPQLQSLETPPVRLWTGLKSRQKFPDFGLKSRQKFPVFGLKSRQRFSLFGLKSRRRFSLFGLKSRQNFSLLGLMSRQK